MFTDQLIPTLRLVDGVDARAAIVAAADALLRDGADNPRMRVVVAGESLSTATVAALITALRRLRERGGAIELAAESETVAAIIRLNGLDRVFAFPIVPNDPPASPRRGGRRLREVFRGAAAALALAAGVSTAGLPRPAAAQAVTDPDQIVRNVIERDPDLASYQSRVHVDLKLSSFPFIAQHLEGSTYFKRPANYEVVFDRVPSYARGFSKLYSDVGDPSDWSRRFVITYAGQVPFEDRTDLALHLVQRVRGMIDHETVLVDPAAWTIDQIRYDYYNGGVITMTQHFTTIDGYTLLASQSADIRIPHVRAVAHGIYTDYRTNVALSDDLFANRK